MYPVFDFIGSKFKFPKNVSCWILKRLYVSLYQSLIIILTSLWLLVILSKEKCGLTEMYSITDLQNVLFTKDLSFNDYCRIYLSIGCDRETSRSVRTLVGRRWGNHGARIRNIKFYISAVTSRYLRQQWSTISAAAVDSQQTLDLDVSVKTSGCLFVCLSVAERVVNRGQHLAAPRVTVCRSDISDHLSAGRLFSVEKVR